MHASPELITLTYSFVQCEGNFNHEHGVFMTCEKLSQAVYLGFWASLRRCMIYDHSPLQLYHHEIPDIMIG